MSIVYNDDNKTFLLSSNDTSYSMCISEQGYLLHLYWGKKISDIHPESAITKTFRALAPQTDPNDPIFSLDYLPLEYPAFGNSDCRVPAIGVINDDGSRICDLKFHDYKIIDGKPKLSGLPATYAESDDEAQTLIINLKDSVNGLTVSLLYTVFPEYNAFTRSVKVTNNGEKTLNLSRILSLSVDMRKGKYELLHLTGAWARECHVVRNKVISGTQSIECRRGASGSQNNPFIALVSENASEDYGDVFALNMVYSGNYLMGVETDQFESSRLFAGINPFDFNWKLEKGESFQSPEAVMVYSDSGLTKMSHTFHRLYRERLCRGAFRDSERPVLINNWEATYFDFNSEKLETIANCAKELGIEMFVLDDGWFGKRNDDKSSLGDWHTNREKIPEGIGGFSEKINRDGIKFGLWFEPEMISKNSELYRLHPDFCIHINNRQRTETRFQLVLDLTREDVREYIEKSVCNILASSQISYVKWDMNRNITEAYSIKLPLDRQGEFYHRYILGLYSIMDNITSKFPEILFEGCASGGGRFDAGILYYMPQIWASDDTDAIERLKVEYGTSFVYPPCAISSHVSKVPNEQMGRTTSLKTRGYASMLFNLGYELDITKLDKNDHETIKEQIIVFKQLRHLIRFGTFFRLRNPFENENIAFMYVSKDKDEAFACYFNLLSTANAPLEYLKFPGLDENKRYKDLASSNIYYGNELINYGLPVECISKDFDSQMFRFKEVKQ